MTELLTALLILMVGVIGIGVCVTAQAHSEQTDKQEQRRQDSTRCANEREAHYMRNFWAYDGSEQKEWNE